jgi:hypothetical protein
MIPRKANPYGSESESARPFLLGAEVVAHSGGLAIVVVQHATQSFTTPEPSTIASPA